MKEIGKAILNCTVKAFIAAIGEIVKGTGQDERAQELMKDFAKRLGILSDGRKVTKELFRTVLAEELEKIETSVGAERYAKGMFAVACELFDKITTDEEFVEFLTLPGYDKLD